MQCVPKIHKNGFKTDFFPMHPLPANGFKTISSLQIHLPSLICQKQVRSNKDAFEVRESNTPENLTNLTNLSAILS